MEYKQEQIQKLHSVLQEILDYIDCVCQKNKLSYLIIGGTALGAKRHKGFIPWDDDLDIGLPRSDYDKLISIIKNNSDLYEIQDTDNEKNYFLPFVKVKKKGTVFREAISDGLFSHNGIYVDVFPIDTIDEIESLNRKLDFIKIKLINHALRFRYCRSYYKNTSTCHKYIIDILAYFPFMLMKKDYLLEKLNTIMRKRNKYEKNYAANLAGTNKLCNEIMPFNVFFPTKPIEFEGKMYPCCNQIEKYLTQLYGDYMEIPPENKRHTHEPLELKF